jgi:pimeloyl-ACP methyl ester carboxylesterase
MSFTAPETRYAQSGELSVAYQVVGDGPIDLVFVPGFVSHLELNWENPTSARFFRRLASFARLIMFDKPGTGLSDPLLGAPPTLDQRMDDVRAVMDAAGSERAALFGLSEGGPMSMLFAATHPGRATHLILFGTFAYAGPGSALVDKFFTSFDFEVMRRDWGSGRFLLEHFVPSLVDNAAALKVFARIERMSASPAMAAAVLRMVREIDVRPVLSAINVPTLVMHRRDEPIPIESAREMAQAIPGARMVELEGDDHFPWLGESEKVVAEVEQFITGTRATVETDRVLATVLFTDIVDSTKVAASAGDAAWNEILGRHNAIVREQIAAFRGREIKTTGDGFLATFDRPAASIRCASSIVKAVRSCGVEIRAGLHTGECELRDDDISGIAVHIGARVASLAAPGEVMVSRTVRDLVAGSGLSFEDRGSHVLKGIDGEWQLYAARAETPPRA